MIGSGVSPVRRALAAQYRRYCSGCCGFVPLSALHRLAMPHPFIQYLASDGIHQGWKRPSQNHAYEESSEMRNGIFHLVTGTAVAIALSGAPASAQKKYDTGASDTEIK